jgi:predicted amidophosphoribosyltransferase
VLDQGAITSLVAALRTAGPPVEDNPWLLVPIPCRTGSTNGLPERLAGTLAAALGWPLRPELLQRSRRQTPQHWLGRQQRWRNQWHSFRALVSGTPDQQLSSVLLVDDVLTSGATALAARTALQAAGWCVAGLACLARTPRPRQGHRGRRGVL